MLNSNLVDQVGFDVYWNNNVPLECRLHTLQFDKLERLHEPIFYLGSKGKSMIVPRIELPMLVTDDSSKVAKLIEFWELW
jgi:hypothetical protein